MVSKRDSSHFRAEYVSALVNPMIQRIGGEDLQAWRIRADSSPEAFFRHFALYHEYESGGSVWLMKGLDPAASDYHDLLDIARIWARQGREVLVLAPVHFKDPLYTEIYGPLIGTKYDWKCPDMLVDGEFYEYESFQPPWKRDKISKMLKNGLRQAPRVILKNRKGGSHRFYIRNIQTRIRLGMQISEVWLYEPEKLIRIYKNNGKTF